MAPVVVGMACEYPGARSPEELFDNVLAGRRAFRRIPDERLPLAEYGSDDPADVDATTVREAALLDGWSFDRVRFKTVGSTYRSADPTHWLALDVADRALRDAGLSEGEGLPRERTGVVLGNTLTGEFTRAQALRLRWPYVRRVLAETLLERVGSAGERQAILDDMEARYKAPFEPFGDESLAGGLANTIAGRICNHFDLGGGGFTVDGACSSSLLAVANASAALTAGELDVALVGGVDLSLDPFELVGFARAGALARREMRVYDERAEGFWPGEGCGVLVLARESWAREHGLRIRARIAGWGIASDGAGGISRPEVAGQLRALRRAYAKAGFGPESVGYFEGHGTGTVVGDATELEALARLLEASPPPAPAAIGSVKASIGHTKAAAGAAGLIQAVTAIERGVRPPTPGTDRPHERVDPGRGASLRVPARPEPWRDPVRRAGVSSMGFGGIDTHVVVESAARPRATPRRSAWSRACESELLVWAAPDAPALRAELERLRARAPGLARAELADLAGVLARGLDAGHARDGVRAALVAADADSLVAGLDALLRDLADPHDVRSPPWRVDAARGRFLGRGRGRIGLLFPGQAAPVRRELGFLGDRLRALGRGAGVDRHQRATDALAPGAEPVDTAVAQPAIVAAALAGCEWLEALGVEAELAVGHSLGEIAALAWADALSFADAVALAAGRGRAMSEHAASGGGMAAVAAGPEVAAALAKQEGCVVAAHNGPQRCAIAGPLAALERVLERARAEGVAAQRLPVSHAFHSPAMRACAEPLAELLEGRSWRPLRRTVVSTRTGAPLEPDADRSRHLVRQLGDPVRFLEALEHPAAEGVDLWIEVGPGRMLASLVAERGDTPVVSLDGDHPGARGLAAAAGAAFALGAPLRAEAWVRGRDLRDFDPEAPRRFLRSPCGLGEAQGDAPGAMPDAPFSEPDGASGPRSALDVVRALAAERCELPLAAVQGGDRFLSDLHLTSIAVGSLAVAAARELDRPPLSAPNEFADASVRELAEAIESEERALPGSGAVAGVDAWVRAFEVVEVERPVPRAASARPPGDGTWRGFGAGPGAGEAPGAEALRAALEREVGGEGVLLVLPETSGPGDDPRRFAALIAAARAACEGVEARCLVCVHRGDPAVAAVRCLHQETPSLRTRVVELPAGAALPVDRIVAEARAAAPWIEARYDDRGRRLERRLRVLEELEPGPGPWLSERDVLLVSGGAKGIGAECALALAGASGCALALLGRSEPGRDAELDTTLERAGAAGLRCAYARADVGDADAVRAAVERLVRELGPVTALVHAAGVNAPASLAALEVDDFAAALRPKRAGLRHLLAAVDPAALRWLVGMGSVVAEIGLPGEAHYALANEAMAREIEAFAAAHPHVRCRAVAWSIWSGVGMGDRLGSVELLAARNITAIPPDLGCAWLERLMRAEGPVRPVLAGRVGHPPTLGYEERPLPLRRFVERVREHTPGVELVVEAELSAERDPWVRDHVVGGQAIVPGVMALEAMAQVARALTGDEGALRFEDVRFLRPVAVPEGGAVALRVAALRARDAHSVELSVRCDATGWATDHVRARVVAAPPSDESAEGDEAAPAGSGVAPIACDGLYGDLFFHGETFRRVRAYDELHWDGCAAELEVRDTAFFGAYHPQALELGDPAARDAAVHALQACLPDRPVLPVAVESIDVLRSAPPGAVQLSARERSRDAEGYVYDLAVRDPGGRLLERCAGLRLRALEGEAPRLRWPPALLAPRLEEASAARWPALGLRAAVVPGTGRRDSERALRLAAGVDTPLRHRGDGRPLLAGREGASASHAADLTLGVVAAVPVGCDLEVVEVRSPSVWRDLLGAERTALAERIVAERGEPLDVAATRVWGAFEALQKAGLPRDTPIRLEAADDEGFVRLAAGASVGLSWAVEVAGRTLVLGVVAGSGDARL